MTENANFMGIFLGDGSGHHMSSPKVFPENDSECVFSGNTFGDVVLLGTDPD